MVNWLPRGIGILLLITAVLAYKTQTVFHAALLGIAGLVLLLTPAAAGKKHWQDFVSSLKLKKEFVVIMLYDILWFVLLSILLLVFMNVMQGPLATLRSIQLGTGITIGQIVAYNDLLQQAAITTILALVLFWLLTVLAYSISRGLVWRTLIGKPVHVRFFVTFSILNLGWCTFWLALMVFVMTSMQPVQGAYASIVLFLLYVHLTTVLHDSYARNSGFRMSFGNAFSTGLGKLGRFVHAYVYLFIGYVILSQMQRLAQGTATNTVITIIVFLAFMAWYRTYLRNVLRKI